MESRCQGELYQSKTRINRPDSGRESPRNAFNTIYNLPRSLNIREFEDDVDEQGNMIWYDASKNPQENPYWVTRYRQNEDTLTVC